MENKLYTDLRQVIHAASNMLERRGNDARIEVAKKLRFVGGEVLEHLEKTRHSQWISVGDKLPEDGQYVLVYRVDKGFSPTHVVVAEYSKKYGFSVSSLWGITHWMPLPSPLVESDV